MRCLSDQIDNGPVIVSALNVVKRQVSQLSSAQTATQQDSQNGSVSFSFQVSGLGSCQRLRASVTVNQFPSLIPNFFAPFTRRIPAASSGLKSPVSAAS
jgi:hypothetical protein